mmetsp:Transcript_51280/g.61771  ORF Transcript_51280/g.61771 Transcript_51280/m.61771 type:complete len:213 (+) Transcript_51280:2322-2960(+)
MLLFQKRSRADGDGYPRIQTPRVFHQQLHIRCFPLLQPQLGPCRVPIRLPQRIFFSGTLNTVLLLLQKHEAANTAQCQIFRAFVHHSRAWRPIEVDRRRSDAGLGTYAQCVELARIPLGIVINGSFLGVTITITPAQRSKGCTRTNTDRPRRYRAVIIGYSKSPTVWLRNKGSAGYQRKNAGNHHEPPTLHRYHHLGFVYRMAFSFVRNETL